MPIYEYRCSSCGHELETLQKFSDAPLVACPSCHATALVKQLSAAGFQLKGSGWYATDFKGGAKPAPGKDDAAATPESGPEKDSTAGKESTSDSKSDTATASKGEAATASKSEAKDAKSTAAAPVAKPGTTPAAS